MYDKTLHQRKSQAIGKDQQIRYLEKQINRRNRRIEKMMKKDPQTLDVDALLSGLQGENYEEKSEIASKESPREITSFAYLDKITNLQTDASAS